MLKKIILIFREPVLLLAACAATGFITIIFSEAAQPAERWSNLEASEKVGVHGGMLKVYHHTLDNGLECVYTLRNDSTAITCNWEKFNQQSKQPSH